MGMVENIKISSAEWQQRSGTQLILPNIGLMLLLIIASAYEESNVMDYHFYLDGAPPVTLTHYQCSRYNIYLHYTITAYFGATIVWGVYITSKAFGALTLAHSLWSNSGKTWEIRLISYAIYVMSATLTAVLIFSPYSGDPFYIHEIVSALIISCGTGVAMSIKWLPKIFLIYNEKLLQGGSSDRAANSGNSPPNTSGLKGSALASGRVSVGGQGGKESGGTIANPVLGSPHSRMRSASPDAEIITNMPERSSLRFFSFERVSSGSTQPISTHGSSARNVPHTPSDTTPRLTVGGSADKEFFAYVVRCILFKNNAYVAGILP
jgi:hypothetical protein